MHLVSYRGRSAVLSRVLLPRHEPRFNNELELFKGGVAITSATHCFGTFGSSISGSGRY